MCVFDFCIDVEGEPNFSLKKVNLLFGIRNGKTKSSNGFGRNLRNNRFYGVMKVQPMNIHMCSKTKSLHDYMINRNDSELLSQVLLIFYTVCDMRLICRFGE